MTKACDVSLPALPVSCCVTTCKWLNLSEPQSPHLKNADQNNVYLIRWFCTFSDKVNPSHQALHTMLAPRQVLARQYLEGVKISEFKSHFAPCWPCGPWARHCAFLSLGFSTRNKDKYAFPTSLTNCCKSPVRIRRWTWVVKMELLCISEWLKLKFISRKERWLSPGGSRRGFKPQSKSTHAAQQALVGVGPQEFAQMPDFHFPSLTWEMFCGHPTSR